MFGYCGFIYIRDKDVTWLLFIFDTQRTCDIFTNHNYRMQIHVYEQREAQD